MSILLKQNLLYLEFGNSIPMVSKDPLYNTKLHHPMSRDYGNNYDPRLVDCVDEEIDCSIFDISFLIEFAPFDPCNPIQDC